jgi:hypothetical protein
VLSSHKIRPAHVPAARSEAKITARLLTAAAGHAGSVQGVVAVVCAGLTIREQPRDILSLGSHA